MGQATGLQRGGQPQSPVICLKGRPLSKAAMTHHRCHPLAEWQFPVYCEELIPPLCSAMWLETLGKAMLASLTLHRALVQPYPIHRLHTEARPPQDAAATVGPNAARLHSRLKQEVQINLSSGNYRGNLGRQNAISQDTEVNTVNLVESAMGPLITATGQGLGFMSRPKDGASRSAALRGWRRGAAPPAGSQPGSPGRGRCVLRRPDHHSGTPRAGAGSFFLSTLSVCQGCRANEGVILEEGLPFSPKAKALSFRAWGLRQLELFLTKSCHFYSGFLTESPRLLFQPNCHWLKRLVRCLHKGFSPFSY